MENIKCIYVDWSAPRILKGLSVKPKKEWEIAILIRSVYYSKNINGFSPVLYCDKITEKYYQCLGIIDIFDEVFPILPIEEKEYNTSIFWAAGKFEAIKHCDSPFILMDLDLEIRKKIDLSDCEVFCSHEERIDENCCLFYPDPNLIDKRNYFRNIGVEFENRAINTSLLYFKDIELAKEYANISIDYMKTVKTPDENLEINSYILLAEQRFLSEFCRIKGISPKKLISGYYVPSKSVIGQMEPPFEESNVSEVSKYFLHIWGYKILLDSDPFLEMDLYRRLIIDSPDEIKDLIENSVELNYSLVQ
jgi:hypothetical protein